MYPKFPLPDTSVFSTCLHIITRQMLAASCGEPKVQQLNNASVYGLPYTAKLSSRKTFVVRVQNFHLQENFYGSMLVDLHWQSTRP